MPSDNYFIRQIRSGLFIIRELQTGNQATAIHCVILLKALTPLHKPLEVMSSGLSSAQGGGLTRL
jgi:hypothetical protein